jgi:putative transposase
LRPTAGRARGQGGHVGDEPFLPHAQKKRLVAREQDRADVKRHRTRWRTHQKRVDPSRLVFIDETRSKTNMTRLYGCAPRRRRLVAKVPHGHWNTATFLAALRNHRIEAPCLSDGSINGERFLAYVEQFLAPPSNATPSSCSTISVRTKAGPREAIRTAGARLLFLPKYSPDLNPIDQVFAKLKTLVRKAAPRTLDAVSDTTAQALTAFSSEECQLCQERRLCVCLNAESSSEGLGAPQWKSARPECAPHIN